MPGRSWADPGWNVAGELGVEAWNVGAAEGRVTAGAGISARGCLWATEWWRGGGERRDSRRVRAFYYILFDAV